MLPCWYNRTFVLYIFTHYLLHGLKKPVLSPIVKHGEMTVSNIQLANDQCYDYQLFTGYTLISYLQNYPVYSKQRFLLGVDCIR